ncbi:MAG: hypothetical protein K6U80_10260 [Firmicutes bacterium]|nr:hypothetical protein [Bacillota bacterium]
MNNQNQNQQMNRNFSNAQAANAQINMETASDLAQSPGAISQLLLAKSKAGFEFGNLGGKAQGQNLAAVTQANAAKAQQEFHSQLGGLSTSPQDRTPAAVTQANAAKAQQEMNSRN